MQESSFWAGIAGGYAVNTVTPYLNGLIGYTFNQAIGAAKVIPRGATKFLRRLDADELEDLAIRIEPPLTRAHTAIGKTAETITFTSRRTPLVLMDPISKSYLEAEMTDGFEFIDTNVTSFNVLTGNGRMYFEDADGTIPFSLHSNPQANTKQTLIRSMEHYAVGHQGTVRIRARRFETADGRLKKFVIMGAEEVDVADWIGGIDPIRALRR